MKDFIEKTLHQKVEIIPYKEIKKFPLVLRTNYQFYRMKIMDQICILAKPEENFGMAALRRQQRQIEHLAGVYCVLYLNNMNYYSRDKMLEEGIPFVWENHQVYIPFLGLLLKQNEARVIKPCLKISFLTQKFLLIALYEEWDDLTVTVVAEQIKVSKMSVTRVFDEIESLGIPVLAKRGRSRRYIKIGSKKEIWGTIRPFLRTPLVREYYLERNLSNISIKSGMSGLAELSMLEDNSYPTYAITKYEIREKGIDQERQIPRDEIPGCVVQEIGYCIPFYNGNIIDPLSIYLLLKDVDDPRVETALEKMLEEYVW
ncbi:MAG TPA: helix-turn-helix domain-containing protein [Candidatus Blautia intestinipullorum]|nr:helix-turn-helix domain-containing protein [Candidatus Blautia intestinipullorum]